MQRLAEELQVANQDGELLFFKGVVLGKRNTVQWMITYPGVYRQKKNWISWILKKNELGQKLCDYGNDSERKWGKNKYN